MRSMANATGHTSSGAAIIPRPIAKNDRRCAEHKYSAAVMKHGYTMLPNLLLRAQGRLEIIHAQFNVLVQLIGHWWEADSNPHPAKETIARRMGKSPRQIQRYLTELEEASSIRRNYRFPGQKAQTSNAYALDGLVTKLKQATVVADPDTGESCRPERDDGDDMQRASIGVLCISSGHHRDWPSFTPPQWPEITPPLISRAGRRCSSRYSRYGVSTSSIHFMNARTRRDRLLRCATTRDTASARRRKSGMISTSAPLSKYRPIPKSGA